MTLLDSIILGIIQGITEFLPISSSGHLVVVQNILGISKSGILFEVSVHLGTLFSILVVFYQDIKELVETLALKETQKLIGYLIIGSLPIAFFGFLFKSGIEGAFQDSRLVGIAFLVTGFVLILTKFKKLKEDQLNITKSFLVGISQAFALLPGISRSGMTISSGLMMGIDPIKAARFSFFLAIPAMIGSGTLMIKEFSTLNPTSDSFGVIILGFISAFIVGIVALKWLLKTLMKGRFHWFGVYCFIIGLITLGL